MNRTPHWRRPAAQHARRVKDQIALRRQAKRIDHRKGPAEEDPVMPSAPEREP
ncbi:hypothetical protein BH10PSE1_BH10PSE1_28320 [soil metagenome]